MDGIVLGLVALAVVGALIALPIIAIVRTARIRDLETRIALLEAALRHSSLPPLTHSESTVQRQASATPLPVPVAPPAISLPDIPRAASPEVPPAGWPQTQPTAPPEIPPDENLELVIGRRWTAWIAIGLIVIATAFFLKYAFENRWIGELGRVTLGVIAGLVLIWSGYQRHGRRWRYLSEVLTGGGIVILYLSVYGAFAYYHLVDQRMAFVFLAILVAEAHLLAMAYDARSIAILGLLGGFLAPVLLSTGRDQYRVLFTYIGILDVGALWVIVARSWKWIGSLAYVGTQFLFWAWYSEHYHPEKRLAALVFQLAVFVIFTATSLAPDLSHRRAAWEEWLRLAVCPFVFYGICYALLNDDYHDWMAVLAILLAAAYSALALAELRVSPADQGALLVTVGTALTFVTIAIPIQLNANWITTAWAVEALLLLWAGIQVRVSTLRFFSMAVFGLALCRFFFIDTIWQRAPFTPVLNRYFLGMLVVSASLAGAAYLRQPSEDSLKIALLAFGVFWFGSSVETYTYFAARAGSVAVASDAGVDIARSFTWAGRMSLSLLWSIYAGLLTAAGFRLQLRGLRVAGLVLFGITLAKVLLVDIAELREFYRILAVLILGLVLLGVAWKYQRGLRREQAS